MVILLYGASILHLPGGLHKTWDNLLPEFEQLFDLFSDFRSGGYRVLSALLCDILQENEQRKQRQLHRSGDSPVFDNLMEAYLSKRNSQHYREAVSIRCWELLLDALEPNVLEVHHAE